MFRRGTRLGVDVGKARIGVARCDPDGLVATPVETVPRRGGDPVARLREIAAQEGAIEFVVGLPLNLHGQETPSTSDARDFAAVLAGASELPVRLVDERLSTVSAHAALRRAGKHQKGTRGIIDQVAAVVFLQQAVDVEKHTGTPAGELVTLAAGRD